MAKEISGDQTIFKALPPISRRKYSSDSDRITEHQPKSSRPAVYYGGAFSSVMQDYKLFGPHLMHGTWKVQHLAVREVIAQVIQDIRGWKVSPSLCEDNMNLDDLSCC